MGRRCNRLVQPDHDYNGWGQNRYGGLHSKLHSSRSRPYPRMGGPLTRSPDKTQYDTRNKS